MALQEKDRDFLNTPVGKTEFSIFLYFKSLPPQVESKRALYNTQLWQATYTKKTTFRFLAHPSLPLNANLRSKWTNGESSQ